MFEAIRGGLSESLQNWTEQMNNYFEDRWTTIESETDPDLLYDAKSVFAKEIVRWAMDEFSLLAATSSGQIPSPALLTMADICAHESNRVLPVIFGNTGRLFAEMTDCMQRINQSASNLIIIEARPSDETLKYVVSQKLYDTNPDQCCQELKVRPMNEMLKCYDAVIAGLRRSGGRKDARFIVLDTRNGGNLIRIHPILTFTSADMERYLQERVYLPQNYLFKEGYRCSAGCLPPCTQLIKGADIDFDHGRDKTRWPGKKKEFCGLNLENTQSQPKSPSVPIFSLTSP